MILSFLLSVLPAITAAPTEPSDTIESSFNADLEEFVVTGTLAPKLLKNTPVQTVVINSKDIEHTDATNVEELLQQEIPGVEFSYAMNQQVHLNFGGFGGQGVLFLVDGERLAGETMDDVDFSRIDMANVERVEIVRGASSALYGSNAAGGVINIITRQPDKKWNAKVSGRIARHAGQRYMASLSAGGNTVANTLTAQYSRINTYDVKSSPDPVTRVITSIYGHRTLSVKDQFTYTPVDALKLSAHLGYFFREIPRIVDTPERYRDYSGGIKGVWKITPSDNIEVSYSFDQYDKSSYSHLSDLEVRNYSNVTNSFRGIYNHIWENGNVFSAGTDYRYDYLNNTKITDGSHHDANFDIFSQFDWVVNELWEVVAAARYDYFDNGHISRVTPKVSARYKPTYNTNLRLGYGMGFRTPTLKEKYYNFDMAGIWIVEGNDELKPETSHNINASFDWTYRNYNATVTGYYNNVSNKIATGFPYYKPGNGTQLYLRYTNLDTYSVEGAEVTVQGKWDCGLSAKLSYAYTHENFPKDKDGNVANNQYIPARRHSMTARIEWFKSLKKGYDLTLGIKGRALSGVTNIEYKDYYDISAGTINVKYPPYTLWKVSASMLFAGKVKLNVAVDNVFNYKPDYYYLNAPLTDGANLMVGLSIDI